MNAAIIAGVVVDALMFLAMGVLYLSGSNWRPTAVGRNIAALTIGWAVLLVLLVFLAAGVVVYWAWVVDVWWLALFGAHRLWLIWRAQHYDRSVR